MIGKLGKFRSYEELTKKNLRLTAEKEDQTFELNKTKALLEKLKSDFQIELRDIRYQIQQEEIKRFNDLLSQMDARVKTIETRRFDIENKSEEEIRTCKLTR